MAGRLELRFTIPHPPVPKGRPRVTRSGHTYTEKRTADWEKLVRLFAQMALPYGWDTTGPMEIEAFFMLKADRGDLDNYTKALMDGLNGVAWDDDKQVDKISVGKAKSKTPGVNVLVRRL